MTHPEPTVARRFLSNQEASRYLGLSPRTLETYRTRGGGPIYCKLGRRVVYAIAELDLWADARKYEITRAI